MINLKAYFERINFSNNNNEQLPLTYETLRAIHYAQVLHIPFEDLALHEMHHFKKCGKHLKKDVIKLDEASLFAKLVTQQRGGYCHENNELLALVLSQLGFNIKRLLARVVYPTGIELPKGHKLLLVMIDNKQYIADVGYGGNGLLEPIALDQLNQEIKQGNDTFKLCYENDNYVLKVKIGENFVSQYEFTLQPFKPIDYIAINKNISSTDSNSIFVKQRMCIKPTEAGRLILVDDVLKIRTAESTTTYIVNDDEYPIVLKELFNIDLGEDNKLKPLTQKRMINSNDRFFNKGMIKQLPLGFLTYKNNLKHTEETQDESLRVVND